MKKSMISGKALISIFIFGSIVLAVTMMVILPRDVHATGGANPQATSKTGTPLSVPGIWTTGDCDDCHGNNPAGSGPLHTRFIPDPANLTLVMDSQTMIESIIRNGIQGTAMPPHPNVTQSQLQDILKFVTNVETNTQRQWNWPYPYFGTAGISPGIRSTPKSVSPDMGRTIFVTECSGCHGPNGSGDPDDYNNPHIWPKPANFHGRNSTVGRDYYIITNGRPGTLMGALSPTLQSEEARWAAALYVNSLLDSNSTDTITTGPMEFWKNPYSSNDRNVIQRGSDRGAIYCGYCHGGQLAGTWMAPSLIDRKWLFGGGTDNAVYQIINDGVPGQLMPPHTNLPSNIRWEIITYLRSQGGLPEAIEGEMSKEASKTQ